jgi:pimeloyl-ACP methyl ester carboxylesterase
MGTAHDTAHGTLHSKTSNKMNGTMPTKLQSLKTINELGNYERLLDFEYLGRVPNTACIADPRFCYTSYIPKNYFDLSSIRLLVLIHGSSRNHCKLQSRFEDYARENNIALLSPLFARGVSDCNDPDNYKNIDCHGIRYDEVLLQMLDQVKQRYPKVVTDKVLMHGFSGGGQFGHRFAYLHPERLAALSCGAPGHITLPDNKFDFPLGTRNLKERFGIALDVEALRKVPIQLIVGAADTGTSHISFREDRMLPEVEGKKLVLSRLEDLHRLEAALWDLKHDNVTFVAVKGMAHESVKALDDVKEYFGQFLTVS